MSEKPEMTECRACAGTGKQYPQFAKLEDLLKFVMEQAPRGPWKPGWFYNQVGDQIALYWKDCATVCTDSGFFTGKDFSLMRERNDDGSCGEVVGVILHGIIARLCAEPLRASYIRPAERRAVACPVCKQVVKKGVATLIYSKGEVECENCAHKFTPN